MFCKFNVCTVARHVGMTLQRNIPPILRSATRKGLPSLPAELRLMIWKATIVPRLLHITVEKIKLGKKVRPGQKQLAKRKSTPSDREIHTHVRFRASEKCPITLHICHESRMEALKYYTPSFYSSTLPQHRASSQKQTAIYFNPELDVVHLPDDRVRFTFHLRGDDETRRRIKVLAVKGSATVQPEAEYTHPNNPLIWAYGRRFKELEEIIWLSDEETMEKAGVIRDSIERHMKVFRDSLLAKGEAWRVPAVKVTDLRTFEREWP